LRNLQAEKLLPLKKLLAVFTQC